MRMLNKPKSQARSIRDVMEQGEVGPLVRKASLLGAMNEALRGVLPPELARECLVANLHQGNAVLLASSGAVAAKLRMLAPRMRVRLAEVCGPIEEVRVDVTARPWRPPAPKARSRVPSALAGKHLTALADRLEDPQLRGLVLALARKAAGV
jgi:hypothetical protein